MTNFTVDVSQIVLFIGVMAFIVSIITEALKKWTWFDKKVPTALTVIILSLILCPVCLLGLAAYYGVAIEWFMVFASFIMFEFVHIVGVSSKALWASLCTIANDFLTKYKRPLFFVCEARGKKADESLEDYVNAMLEERKGINNIYMQVVCSNSRYQRMDGRVQDINNAGIVTGLYGRAKESQSIGEVKSFPISEAKLLKLLPEGIEDYIETLDKAKYVTIRQYIGKEDYYVTSANMMSPEGSDYSYAEDVRVSNRLVKAVRAKALDELQVEVDPEDIETSITNIQEQLNTPVEDAVRDKIISSGSVTIDTENLNILVDEKLDINITYVPMGHVREMNLTFAVENPYSAS